jgi:hypothetical protein
MAFMAAFAREELLNPANRITKPVFAEPDADFIKTTLNRL